MKLFNFGLLCVTFSTASLFAINDELVTEFDFEDFEVGPGNLAPSTGSLDTSVHVFRSDFQPFPWEDATGVAEFEDFNKGKQAYIGGLDLQDDLGPGEIFFSAIFFG